MAEIRPELGIPVVQLPFSESGTQQSRSLQLGTLESNGSRTQVWVSYSTEANTPAMVTQLVAEALRPSRNAQPTSKAESSIQLKLHALLPVQPERLPGYRGDIPAVDVVQVNKTLGDALGKWALAMTVDVWLITFGIVLLLAIIPVRLTESQRRRSRWADEGTATPPGPTRSNL